ncbi:MAG: protein kinase [Kiritimatiellae bacterium]|nr:protein kinase [Kiritimatiellia bacterium]
MPDALDMDGTVVSPGEEGRATLEPGGMLGQYRILRLLGRGGMGEVYEVEHTTLELRYALKLLPPDFAVRPGALERFRREAKVMAKLQHRHIVRVDDFGDTDGRYWLRMELVGGLTIDDRRLSIEGKPVSLQEYAEAQRGRLPQNELLELLRQVLAGLAYAHEHGAIHRDLKPSNILLASHAAGGIEAKIADFGLVRLVGEEWVRSQAEVSVRLSMGLRPGYGPQVSLGDERTMAGADTAEGGASTRAMLGTYEYMSPEQKLGEEADQRSDLYALGLMTYRLLTGRRELSFNLPSQIDSALVPQWDAVVRKAVEPVAAERYASCAEFGTALDDVARALGGADRAPAAKATKDARPAAKRPPPIPTAKPKPAPAAVCSACGAAVHKGDKFCTACGMALKDVRTCSKCGKAVQAADKFCIHCGGTLGEK